jgi:hypothetical protein
MKGSCACQRIQYELVGEILFMNHCHCSISRKIHGAAFRTFGHAKAEGFCWLKYAFHTSDRFLEYIFVKLFEIRYILYDISFWRTCY